MTEIASRRAEQTSTQILRSLFGSSVGVCWGDFSCSHYRQRGRLYAASNAIAFFSNLFGFERRICLQLDDVTDIQAFRTTSVQITTIEGEQYIFKSFRNRELVVLLLQQLKQEHTNGPRPRTYSDQSIEILCPLETSVDFSNPPIGSTRHQRTKSLPAIVTKSLVEQENEPQMSDSDPEDAHPLATDGAVVPATRGSSDIPPTEYSPGVDSSELWEKVKDANDPQYGETSIDGLVLPCTLDEFFALFLADSAPHAMDAYQRGSIGDSELSVSPWTAEADDAHVRLIEFRHPLPNGLGVGPASALAERRQRFKRYGDCGFCIETSTYVKGVVASDCFHVADKWIVEAITETNVKLMVKHQVRFTKRTMLKRIIQTTSNAEARAWYEGYSQMLLDSLKDKSSQGEETLTKDEAVPNDRTGAVARKEEKERPSRVASVFSNITLILLLGGCLIAGLAFAFLHLASLHEKLQFLQDELERSREDNLLAFARLEEGIASIQQAMLQIDTQHE